MLASKGCTGYCVDMDCILVMMLFLAFAMLSIFRWSAFGVAPFALLQLRAFWLPQRCPYFTTLSQKVLHQFSLSSLGTSHASELRDTGKRNVKQERTPAQRHKPRGIGVLKQDIRGNAELRARRARPKARNTITCTQLCTSTHSAKCYPISWANTCTAA
jgi:hypothetical protein